jgi:hypothetical protein
MQKRRTDRVLFAAVVVLAGGVVAGAAATGRLPFLSHAPGEIASSVASSMAALLPSSMAPPSPPATDASAKDDDTGAPVHRQTAPLSSAQLGAPLVHGTFVSACGAPDDMKVVVDVAVKRGRAVNVTVKTRPPSAQVASCIEHATRNLQWDISPKTDHVTVTY